MTLSAETSAQTVVDLDKARPAALRVPWSMLRTRFVTAHLTALYQRFEGDLLLPLVLGEVATRNFQAIYQMRTEGQFQLLIPAAERHMLETGTLPRSWMRPANIMSIAAATGVPRETVRRKVEALVGRGWVERNASGHLYVTDLAARELESFDLQEAQRFQDASAAAQRIKTG